MRKIIAALLLTSALAFTAIAGETPNNTPANTDGVIECPYTDGQMEFPLVGEMGFPLLLMLLL